MSDDRTFEQRVDALWCSLDDQLAHHSDDDPPPMAMCRIALEAAGLPDLLAERAELIAELDRFRGPLMDEAYRLLASAEVDLAAAQEERDSLRLERDGAQHCHRKDNEYLTGELAAAQAAADEWKMQANAMAKALGPVQDDWRDAQAAAREMWGDLQEIVNVLGSGPCEQIKCDGCEDEFVEAADVARRALAAHPEFAPDMDAEPAG